MNDVLDTLKKLPPMCATRNAATGEPIIIKRGVMGYYHSPYLRTNEDIKKFNDELRVTDAMREAMECGSMFGWHVPGADPDTYTGGKK